MRFLKFFLAITLLFIIILSSIFFARSALIKQLANNYLANSYIENSLAEHKSQISCIEFDLTRDLTIAIEKLCIKSPYADITIRNAAITWQFSASDLLTGTIDHIDVSSMSVTGRKPMEFISEKYRTSQPEKAFDISHTPAVITSLINSMNELSVPISLEVKHFYYQPFISDLRAEKSNHQEKINFQGMLAINKKNAQISLLNAEKTPVLSIDAQRIASGFKGNINADTAEIITFLSVHNIPFPSNLTTDLQTKSGALPIDFFQGQLNSDFSWSNNELIVKSQFTEISYPITLNEPTNNNQLVINVEGDLSWEARLVNDALTFDFEKSSQVSLFTDNDTFVTYISSYVAQQKLPDLLVNLVQKNNIAQFKFSPLGSVYLDFSTKKISVDDVSINSLPLNDESPTSSNKRTPFTLHVSDIELSYLQRFDVSSDNSSVNSSVNSSDNSSSSISVDLEQADFALTTAFVLPQLKPFSEHPLLIKASGSISQEVTTLESQPQKSKPLNSKPENNKAWKLTLNPSSHIQLSQFSHRLKGIPEKKEEVTIAKLISHFQGSISLDAYGSLSFLLQSNHYLKDIALANALQLKETQLAIELSGNLDNISVKGALVGDGIPLAKVSLQGNAYQPKFTLSASQLLVTDILALTFTLPIELKLIDGMLSYQLSGQLGNLTQGLSNGFDSPMALSLSLKNITGDIAGTWLQDIHWQQNFVIENKKITSIPSASPNLFIGTTESAIPIDRLSMKTWVSLESGHLQAKVNNVRGRLLGGSFMIKEAQWPFKKEHSVDIQLETIDLEQLLALDKKQGIVVTGKVSGELTVFTDGYSFLVKDGELHNVGKGVIQIFNNPAVEELKASGTQLKLAFDALENLQYHHLYSSVSMADDGYMLLDTVIKGINPDLDNDVNLNLNLSYDLLGLLESLNITEQFENKVLKELQKN